jgi:hypothetical protein
VRSDAAEPFPLRVSSVDRPGHDPAVGRLQRVDGPDEYLQGEAQSLAGITSRMQKRGFTAHFGARPGATVMCFTCRAATGASRFDVRELRRLEGASDPADMLAVAALRCGGCGSLGTIVLGYGPGASLEDAEVLAALPDPAVGPIAEAEDASAYAASATRHRPQSGRFPFRSDDRIVRTLSRCFGITPSTSEVRVEGGTLLARFGPWTVRTAVDNVTSAEVSGPFSVWKVGGPARLSLADRGITFATSRVAGACITFAEPVTAIDPFGLILHPNLTVTVEQPELLCALLDPATR